MRFNNLTLATIAALSLFSAPVMAQSLPISSKATVVSKTAGGSKVKRVVTPSKDESKAYPGGVGGILASAAILAGALFLVIDNDDDDGPTSP